MFRFWLAALILLVSGCSSYDVKSNLSYDKNKVPYGVFDWYRPVDFLGDPIQPGANGLPTVVLIHGGAWMGGNKTDMKKVADALCAHGYNCVAPNYHLTADITMPDGSVVKGAPWPAQFDDLEAFLLYLHDNAATFGINPKKIASLGISAGGHLAQMLHLRPGQVNTITACDLDGETDLTQPGDKVMTDFDNIMTKAIGHPKPWTQAELKDISPVFLVNSNSHIFINHGELDANIYVAQADILAAKCQAVGADFDYVRLPGKRGDCHGDCWQDPESLDHLIKWLDKHLK